jgi:hypothetical protein
LETFFPIIGKLFLAALAALLLATAAARADETWPVGISFAPTYSSPDSVNGLALGLPWGDFESVTGIEAALVANYTARRMTGLQVTPGVNMAENPFYAWQIALIANFSGDAVGIQTALGVNWGGSTLAGAQIGLWNRAEEIHGLQLGLVNTAITLHGLQLGLLNFVSESPFPCLPLLRFSF